MCGIDRSLDVPDPFGARLKDTADIHADIPLWDKCSHDPECPGYGLGHDAELSRGERERLGIPLGKDLSRQKVKRLMRSVRKAERDAEL